jgi:Fic-DOC domain mobile mystery protein B
MGLDLSYIDGQTPIDESEKEGLLIETIVTQAELDEFEQLNIEEALQWIAGRSLTPKQLFSVKFICDLHKQMFGIVWNWAGAFRKTEKNIGVKPIHIATQLKSLCDDTLYWIDNQTFSPEEIAVRFKHRLVSIHCFSNGNGRHSRLMADIIIEKIYNKPPFSWGAANLSKHTDGRKTYLRAVKQADRGNFDFLISFAQS